MRRSPLLQSSGFSLLELVVSLALGSSILLGMSKLLSSTQHFKARADIESSVQELDTLLAAELSSLIRAYDSQPLHIPPIIHERGVIKFADGKPTHVHRGEERLRPAAQARAISVLIPAFDSRLRIRSAPLGLNHVRGCSPDGRSHAFSDFRSALMISVDGISEARIESAKVSVGSGCYELSLQGSESAFYPALSSEELPFVRLILPIDLEYTLYLSRSGDLRYLGQAGAENIENQPIASHLENFQPSLLTTTSDQLIGIKLQASLHGIDVARSALSRFSKHRYVDLLINES